MNPVSATCPQCGTLADTGGIFCEKCGATRRTPTALVAADSADAPVPVAALKRATIVALKAIGVMAGLVFWLSRVSTETGIVLFVASIVVLLLCFVALSYLDEDFMKKHDKEEYWPKPIDWGTSQGNNAANDNASNDRPL